MLGAFGFFKEITHRGKKSKIEIEGKVNCVEDSLKIPCPNKDCHKKIVNQQGLSVHMKCIHPLAEYASNNSQWLLEEPAIEFVVQRVLQRTVNIVCKKMKIWSKKISKLPSQGVAKVSLRGRSGNKRLSYSSTFKLGVINESDSGRNDDEIASQFGIN